MTFRKLPTRTFRSHSRAYACNTAFCCTTFRSTSRSSAVFGFPPERRGLFGFKRFPTPATIRELDLEKFTSEAWNPCSVAKWRSAKKLVEIYAMAAESIALPVAKDSPAIEMFCIQLARYADLNEKREELDDRAQQLLAGNADFHRLQTLPRWPRHGSHDSGGGRDLRRFDHHRQFLKYCGLDLAKSQSGQSRGTRGVV